jgi:hypothetical protein
MLVRLVSPSAQGVNMYSLSVSLAYMLPWRRLMSWRIQNGALNNPLREWRTGAPGAIRRREIRSGLVALVLGGPESVRALC